MFGVFQFHDIYIEKVRWRPNSNISSVFKPYSLKRNIALKLLTLNNYLNN